MEYRATIVLPQSMARKTVAGIDSGRATRIGRVRNDEGALSAARRADGSDDGTMDFQSSQRPSCEVDRGFPMFYPRQYHSHVCCGEWSCIVIPGEPRNVAIQTFWLARCFFSRPGCPAKALSS